MSRACVDRQLETPGPLPTAVSADRQGFAHEGRTAKDNEDWFPAWRPLGSVSRRRRLCAGQAQSAGGRGLPSLGVALHWLAIRAATTCLTILFSLVMFGLIRWEASLARLEHATETEEGSDSGTVERWETIHLWLPESVCRLAAEQAGLQILRNHEELRRVLESRRRQDLRYAVTSRAHQADGGYVDISYVRRPYDDPQCFEEFLDVLARVGGTLDGDAPPDLAIAPVHVVPEPMLSLSPSDLYPKLQAAIRRSNPK